MKNITNITLESNNIDEYSKQLCSLVAETNEKLNRINNQLKELVLQIRNHNK